MKQCTVYRKNTEVVGENQYSEEKSTGVRNNLKTPKSLVNELVLIDSTAFAVFHIVKDKHKD